MKVLLINQYAGNKGDRAVLYATCLLLRSIDPCIEISVSTSTPKLWDGYLYYKENSIAFVPSSWDYKTGIHHKSRYWNLLNRLHKYTFTIMRENLLSLHLPVCRMLANPLFYKEAKSADLIISIGGHHYTTILSRDLVSSINFDAMSVLTMKKPLICFSQSFGPFEFHNNRNRLLTQKILSNCRSLHPREEQAEKSLLTFGIDPQGIKRTYETVLSLNSLFSTYIKPTERKKEIGIAIYSTQKRTPQNHKNYINTIASFCDYTIEKGYSIRFFPMELKGTAPDDRLLIKEIIAAVQPTESCTYIDKDMPTNEHLQEVSKCQLFIGHKTHSTIFAIASGTPLIGIAYHPKTIEFMKQFGISEYAVDDNKLSLLILQKQFEQIEKDLDSIGTKIFKSSKTVAETLRKDLFSILKNRL